MAKIENQLEKFQLLFDNAPAALLAIDQNCQVIDWNKNIEFVLGWKKEQILGQSFPQILISPSSHATVEENFKKIISDSGKNHGNSRTELIALRKDGSEFPAELTLIPIQTSSDLIIFARLHDLTETKKQAADANKANIFLNAIVENIPDMIFIKEAKFFTSIDRNVLDHKRLIEIPEEPIQTKFKGQRLLHTKKVPIYDENGDPEFLLGISEDITDKKKAEETQKNLWQEQQARLEAEKALQLRDDFISIAAHELRTPLTALSLQIQLLNKFVAHVESSQTDKFLTMMNSSQQQLNRFEKLIEDMLDVSRASAGVLIFEKTEVNLSDTVQQNELGKGSTFTVELPLK